MGAMGTMQQQNQAREVQLRSALESGNIKAAEMPVPSFAKERKVSESEKKSQSKMTEAIKEKNKKELLEILNDPKLKGRLPNGMTAEELVEKIDIESR